MNKPKMKKLVRKLVADDVAFEDVLSFKTESYIGIWNHASDEFVLICPSDCELYIRTLPYCRDLQELDDSVCEEIGEHIICVSESSDYEFKLLNDDVEE